MRTLTFTFDSSLSPARALEAAHDFTGRHSDRSQRSKPSASRCTASVGERVDVAEGTGTGIGPTRQRYRYDWPKLRVRERLRQSPSARSAKDWSVPPARLKVP